MPDRQPAPSVRRLTVGGFLLLVLGLSFWILLPFLASLAWAAVLAYTTWPLYQRLRLLAQGRDTLAAILMVLCVAALLLGPLVWVLLILAQDLAGAGRALNQLLAQGVPPLPEAVRHWPLIGDALVRLYDGLRGDADRLQQILDSAKSVLLPALSALAGEVGRNIAKFGFAVLALFFFYRDGDSLLAQVRHVATLGLGERAHDYLAAIGTTLRAVVFGIVLTALAQGLLAGLGYWAAGVTAPVLWGVITAVVSLIPFAGPIVWIGLSISLAMQGAHNEALGLFLWGALVVSWVDNLIRPIVVSGATRIPFLLVLFGVLGGVAAFGLIGLFAGPVVLGMALAVWREWVEEQAQTAAHERE
jgi:predicted PurR-regulated permease PerM